MTVGVILLAGGRASRFGSDKRLTLLQDGRTLLQASIDSIRRAGLPLLVCLGIADDEIEQTLLDASICCRKCPDSPEGMASTLANGIATVAGSWRGALVALADMPLIRPGTYNRVRDELRPGTIVAPTYGGRRGHPVGFDRSYFPELIALGGDRGAREVLAAHPDAVLDIEVPDPGVLADVDVVEDLRYVVFPGGTARAKR